MKRLALLLAICSTATFAASWDGTKGSFAIITFTFQSGTGANTPGVPIVPGPLVWHTTMFIKCSDPSVTAARVRISWRDSNGDHASFLLADFAAGGYGGVTMEIPLEQITDAHFTELKDGAAF